MDTLEEEQKEEEEEEEEEKPGKENKRIPELAT